jgi:hypothetical protein
MNTSNSPNTKVVYFVEGHNFHVEWHWRFGVEEGEKGKSTLPGHYSLEPRISASWHENFSKLVEKKTLRPLQKL